MVEAKEYEFLNKIKSYIKSPWKDNVLLNGTDGVQFSPDSSTHTSVISTFVNDISRNCYFDYSHKDDTYSHIVTEVYKM